ncbi:MAG: HAD-superfamily hydrolase, subfamily [Firmicutes bacterium]|nr:HAD-superfamily hydrolase, subfamily [Bacillota bacterium]
MEKKKFFFFDYDGTLTVGPGGDIPESAKKTIDLLSKNGHFVAVATGRIQCDAHELCNKIGIHNFVSDGGNGLTINGKLIYLESLDIPLAIQLLDELEQKRISWAVTCENSRIRYAKNENFTREIKDTYMTTIVKPELDYNKLDQLYKVFISCSPEKQNELIMLEHLPSVRFNPNCLFVEPDDKAAGIVKMIQHFNASQQDVVVFGDGMNDLKMFREEWTSIAMGNARDALKEKADFVTKSHVEDGIEYACRHFGWI